MVYTVCIVWYSILYSTCIICNSIYQYVRLCDDDVRLNEARHIWHIDRVTEQWQNLEQVSIWFSASVPNHKAICYLLLSHAILYLCAISVSAVCYLYIAFSCVTVNVLYCLCEHIYYLYNAVMSAVVSSDPVILFWLYYCISYYMIFTVYYYL